MNIILLGEKRKQQNQKIIYKRFKNSILFPALNIRIIITSIIIMSINIQVKVLKKNNHIRYRNQELRMIYCHNKLVSYKTNWKH